MSLRKHAEGAQHGAHHYPREATEFFDEVSKEQIEALRKEVGDDFASDDWEVIDGFGQLCYA